MEKIELNVEGVNLSVTNPGKVLWPALCTEQSAQQGITKLDYIRYLLTVAPYMLAYTKNRLLTMIRYPDGVDGKSFYQKALPAHVPAWLAQVSSEGKRRVLLNNAATLAWVAAQGALELHTPFNTYDQKECPRELIIDLDPMDVNNFDLVREIALETRLVLDSLGLISAVKTSGATGLQIYVPIAPRYSYEDTRQVNLFIARYIAEKKKGLVTLERAVKKRGSRLYFDYLQLWAGRTLPVPYSLRARPLATVSTPLEWEEIERNILPADFTILNVPGRLKAKGDLFRLLSTERKEQGLEPILAFVNKHH